MNKQECKTLAKAILVCMLAVPVALTVAVLLVLGLSQLIYTISFGHNGMNFVMMLNLFVVVVVVQLFPLIQYVQAHWLWHTQDMAVGQEQSWRSRKIAALPKIVKLWPQRLLEVGLQVVAMLLLLLLWPFSSQEMWQYWVDWANESQLSASLYLQCGMIVGAVLIGVLVLVVHGTLRWCALHYDTDSLRYRLWRVWLWAYVLAFACCVCIILMLGMMMVHILE